MAKTQLEGYVERAIRAVGNLTPTVVYIPTQLRRKRRVTLGGNITINAPDNEENVLRVQEADPVGFLIAVMQGQPVPSFEVQEISGDKLQVTTKVLVPTLDQRMIVAQLLARWMRNDKKPDDRASYDAMIKNAASRAVTDKEEM